MKVGCPLCTDGSKASTALCMAVLHLRMPCKESCDLNQVGIQAKLEEKERQASAADQVQQLEAEVRELRHASQVSCTKKP